MSFFVEAPKLSPVWVDGRTDGVNWYLLEKFPYESDMLNDTIVVPAGFVTDFASIPREFWNALPPWGMYGPAAIIHDWLYWQKFPSIPRVSADLVLREAMLASGTEHGIAEVIYKTVEMFGQAGWDKDAATRAAGYSRIFDPANPAFPPA